MKAHIVRFFLCAVVLFTANIARPQSPAAGSFQVQFNTGAITSLKRGGDNIDLDYIGGRRLGDFVIRYRVGAGDWQSVQTATLAAGGTGMFSTNAAGTEHAATYPLKDGESAVLELGNRFVVRDREVVWTLTLRNLAGQSVEVSDLSSPLSIGARGARGGGAGAGGGGGRGNSPVILKHSFISGHGSFMFWMRNDLAGPYLTLVPEGKTPLEFWQGGRGAYNVFIHSTAAGAEAKERGTNWRQPHTKLMLAPKGQAGDERSYSFKLLWSDGYDGVRQNLVDEGGIDTHVVPGMTVPTDLSAQIALRTKHPINAVEPEFPNQTKIESLGKRGDYQLYQVSFSRLGENRLNVRYGDDKHMYLEFFATEPLETLIKKRAAFLARSQHRDPSKWYNGLITDWAMDTKVLLSPDNYDRIRGFRIYAVTCDDPGLGKPAYLAAKNADHPVQSEVEALDYYIKHFVWGGLQQTTEEPYPFGIYGIPDWKTNRDSADEGRNGKRHLWRVYDYPHIIQMYFGMYRVAKNHPQIKTAMTAKDYLTRAFGTARAMFTVPMEIERWSAYRTGFYNELVIVDLIAELEIAGMKNEAATLRDFWDRKVKSFVNREQDLFRSEYAFDSTGFESTHALAKWAMQHADAPGETNSGIPLANAQRFLEKQMAANLFCRGWVEPAYYYLGSDYRGGGGNGYVLTYMSQMGGWGVLDYGLNFTTNAAPYLRLGYNSYLSAWALMNSGTPESNYGYWYPGKENDGGAGGGFEPAPFGQTWLGQPHTRGSWYYACEIDLGYCGALRTAATVLIDDPIFGRVCLGGGWRSTGNNLEVFPKDGLRRRFHARLGKGSLSVASEADRFPASQPLVLKDDLSEVRFQLESDNPGRHTAKLLVSGEAGEYEVRDSSGSVANIVLRDGQEAAVEVPMREGVRPGVFTIARRVGSYRR
jgi:hypothetical protein